MTIGAGIAIAGAWVFAGIVWNSRQTTAAGMWVALAAAAVVTSVIVIA